MKSLRLLMFMSLFLFAATSCTISFQNISTSGGEESDEAEQSATADVRTQIPASLL